MDAHFGWVLLLGIPKMGRHWKRLRPISSSHAMELDVEYKRAHDPQFSMQRLADALGQNNTSVVYKWMSSGRLPLVLIPAWSSYCGANYISEYLALSCHKLLVDIPTGRNASSKELHQLSITSNETMGLLMKFYEGESNADDTLGAITNLMSSLSWHHKNIEKNEQPEFDFDVEEK